MSRLHSERGSIAGETSQSATDTPIKTTSHAATTMDIEAYQTASGRFTRSL